MEARIELLESKKMLGIRQAMSLVDNKTFELFSTFMPRRKEILHTKNDHIFDLREYPEHYFAKFNPAKPFTKWALKEVEVFDDIPNGMEQFELGAGLYAVFMHKGWNPGPEIFQYIFSQWLPASEYELDKRPHFELFGPKTKRNSPDSEEEIWIPIKPKP